MFGSLTVRVTDSVRVTVHFPNGKVLHAWKELNDYWSYNLDGVAHIGKGDDDWNYLSLEDLIQTICGGMKLSVD